MEDKAIYTTKEAANYLGVSPSTIYRMEKSGLLSLIKTSGGQRRFSQKNIPLDKNKGGQQSVCADITTIAKQVGWKYHSTIIWNEQNISRRTAWKESNSYDN